MLIKEGNPLLLLHRVARLRLITRINEGMFLHGKAQARQAIRRLNKRHGTNWTYQHGYMAAVAGLIPAERDKNCRFWLIDDSNLSATRKALGQLPTRKPAGSPAAKPKLAAKPIPKSGSTRPARSRATRPAA